MGSEIVYDIYEECDCEECGNNIKYRISGYEYPVIETSSYLQKMLRDLQSNRKH